MEAEITNEARANLAHIVRVLSRVMKENDADGGKTFDRMAENIRRNAADGLIEEAIGYLPPEAEIMEAEDNFRPLIRTPRSGLGGKGPKQDRG